ncbi:MAG: formate dehydrogenase accessory protein FdhE, partial [Chloroflexota bacterium]|nr:formate dehydrogenase accessory protein FdhE [Chloroflexota bacterium]
GLPLLHEVDLRLDERAARDLMVRIARALEEAHTEAPPQKHRAPWRRGKVPDAAALFGSAHAGDGAALRAAAAREIRLALEEDRIEMGALLSRVAGGDSPFVTALAQGLKLDAGLTWTLAQNSFKPALRAWQRQLAPLAQGVTWHKGYCFVCGGAATLGELQGNDQEKHLRCGQCGADWQFPRLQCMYCGNQDHRTFGYLYPESQGDTMRVEICDNCHGYLKIINAFSPTPPESLAVQDLATLHLDYIAQERGYARVALQ